MTEPIIGSQVREEAKGMGMLPNRTRRAEVAFFLRQALFDFGIKMYDPDEGILLANRFISYLEVLQGLGRLPGYIQALMIAYYGGDRTQEEVAENFHMSERTFRDWLTRGLDQMANIIWD